MLIFFKRVERESGRKAGRAELSFFWGRLSSSWENCFWPREVASLCKCYIMSGQIYSSSLAQAYAEMLERARAQEEGGEEGGG